MKRRKRQNRSVSDTRAPIVGGGPYTLNWMRPKTNKLLRWVEVVKDEPGNRKSKEWRLCVDYRLFDGGEFVGYTPMYASALYRFFAAVEPTRESILEFANLGGFLTGDTFFPGERKLVNVLMPDGTERPVYSESLRLWLDNLFKLRETLRIWDAARAGDLGFLKTRFRWEGRDRVHYIPPPPEERKPFGRVPPHEELSKEQWATLTPSMKEFFEEERAKVQLANVVFNRDTAHTGEASAFRANDLVAPAASYVMDSANRMMEGNVRPFIWWGDRTKHSLQSMPTNLLGAIWLQLAEAFIEGAECRACEACGRLFDVFPGKARSDRKTCSATCRTNLYRKRVQAARDRYALGTPVKQIAADLGTTVAQVKEWITEKGK